VVQGFAQEQYAPVRAAFADNLASGVDLGAALCVTVDGETVVDLWGGFADAARTRPWQRDTIVNVFSTTKTVTALTALLLADRGELDVDAPVKRYWPEFAANGKDRVKVSHVLSHSAGLPIWRQPMRTEDLYDWEKATALLAAQPPDWEPGTACGYHALTQGYLIGEVVRRITGRSLGTVLREEITEPLDADFHIGLPLSACRCPRSRASPSWSRRPRSSRPCYRPRQPTRQSRWRRSTRAPGGARRSPRPAGRATPAR
jgi:CubicO group peptidase (beta-lactamase class C family)